MASLLLIGGTGFLGKSFLDAFGRGLLDKWEINKVIVMSRDVERLRREAPELLGERIELISGDIGLIDSLPFADYVIHAAASTNASNYLLNGDIETLNIERAVHNYCKLAPKYHAASKIAYVSSGAAYGVQPLDIPFLVEDLHSFSLDALPKNKYAYALEKLKAEGEFRKLGRDGLKANIARCFTFIGPWLPLNQHFAIGNFLQDGLKGSHIKVECQRPVVRSYMYSDDMVRWLMTITDNASLDCEIYNVGSDEGITLTGLAKMIGSRFGVCVDSICDESKKISDIYVPSVNKARLVLGLEIDYKISDALNITIAEFRRCQRPI